MLKHPIRSLQLNQFGFVGMKMKVKLKKLGTISTGNTPSKNVSEFYDSEDIGLVKPDIISDSRIDNIDKVSEYLSEAARTKARIVKKNTVFVTCIGSIGKVGIAKEDEFAFNQQINAIEPNEKILPKYLAYGIFANKKKLQAIANAPVVPIINKTQFGEFEIDITDDVDEQARIIELLDKVCAIIRKRKAELDKLDELIKARFVELFRDGAEYKKEPLIDNVQEMFIGPFGSSLKNECFVDETDSYCMVYEQKHAIQKTMNLPTRYVDETKYNELKRFTVIGGDIIVSCRGTIGEIYSVPDDAPRGIMHPSIMKIRLKKDKYCNLFFVLMLERYMQENIAKANGSGIKMAVTATDLGKELFVVPSIEEQRNFENFVLQVDKSKVINHI